MALTYCAECGHEISTTAVACPNCGRPVMKPVTETNYVVAPPVQRESGFPTWAFVPVGIVVVVLIFLVFVALRGTDDSANTNISVRANSRATPSEPLRETRTTSVASTDSQTVTVPPGQTTATTVPGTTTSVPVAPPSDKGTVVINARIAPKTGAPQNVRNAKFYLLDKDVEAILSDARVVPIEGNDLMSSLGLAIVFPDRYGDFMHSAMRAVASHSKYSGTTDSGGNASLQGISPKEYYLFGVTKVGRGFALWNAPVSVIAGQNNLNLSPQSVVEIPDSSG
ncbi:MAG: zinc ribbon domain-containing protein [Chloracidobacterium sp.]|nr:zinc ribbon domain-containing protein [Chloracidobacterium sp.]